MARLLDYLDASAIVLADIFRGATLTSGARPLAGETHRPLLYLAAIEERLDYYTSLISNALGRGKNVLMLLPDSHGSGAFFSRALQERLPGAVLWYHSAMTEKKKAETYFRARSGPGHLILGNKSCIFLPVGRTSRHCERRRRTST
jgi:primosomal protein N'